MKLKGLAKVIQALEVLQQAAQDLIDANDENMDSSGWGEKAQRCDQVWMNIDQAKDLLGDIKDI